VLGAGNPKSELVRDNPAGEEEAGAWVEDLRQTAERGEYFFSLNQYLYLVVKPQ
jgi:hypothetical protein